MKGRDTDCLDALRRRLDHAVPASLPTTSRLSRRLHAMVKRHAHLLETPLDREEAAAIVPRGPPATSPVCRRTREGGVNPEGEHNQRVGGFCGDKGAKCTADVGRLPFRVVSLRPLVPDSHREDGARGPLRIGRGDPRSHPSRKRDQVSFIPTNIPVTVRGAASV